MVQSKMGIAPYQPINYEYIDAVPIEQKIKKKVQANGEWVDRIFIRIPVAGTDKFSRGNSDLEEWCYDHYGSPVYLGAWCKVSGYVILEERTYTHWMLCK